MRLVWLGLALVAVCLASAHAQSTTGTALVRHAPTLNGPVQGSIQQMTAESTTLNGGASVTGDLLVPGSPLIRLNGNPVYGGTIEGTGVATPTNHTIILNGGASLGHVVRRTNGVALPAVAAPPQPVGTRSASLNNSGQSPGAFATLKNLTLNSNVGQIVVPPGTYGNFTANSGGGFTIGVAGAATPAVYNFQNLTLNSNSSLTVVGPVVVTLNGGFSTNGPMGTAAHPEWLALRIAGGGLSLNGNVAVYANLVAPDGTITLNGSSRLIGAVTADRLTVNGNSLLQLTAPVVVNQPPVVALTAPAAGASYTAPAALVLEATASDSDGTVSKVEFYEGTAKLGEDASAPYTLNVSGLAAGSHTFKARAIDSQNASTDSATVTVLVTAANQPPTVSLTAPADGANYVAPAVLALTAAATDSDGSVAKVEFYQGTTKVGEDPVAPYQFTTSSLAAGSYTFSARAYDNLGATAISTGVAVTVAAPNQAPTVTLTAPSHASSFNAPAGFQLAASASDPDGSVTKVEFYQDGTKIGQDTTAPFEFAVSSLAVGIYHFSAKATDNAGLVADSASITVTVLTPNVPPTVTLTAPTQGANCTAPATISMAATASDSDGSVTKVEFFNGESKLGEALAAPFEFTWTPVVAGTYVLTAKATDDTGATATSDAVTVAVIDNGVPFLANFEPGEGYQPGPLSGQKGWSVAGAAEIVTSPRYAGQQAVSVAPAAPPALVVRAFVNADPSVTFVDLFAQPAAAATAADGVFFETDATRVALTGAAPTGILQAFNGDGAGGGVWFSTEKGPLLDGTGRAVDWLRLTVRSDYGSKKWDLYFNGQMIAANLGFVSNAQTAFTGLGLSGHTTLTTGFDDLLVAFDNPLFADADHDGMDDAWETSHGLNPAVNDRDADLDGDGLTNIEEYVLGTDPSKTDTDGDGLSDSQERTLGTDPKNADTDGDGLPDGWEKAHNLDPRAPADATLDADGDGQTNLAEYQAGTDPVDYYNGAAPQLTIVSGNNQTGAPGQFNALPMVVLVTNAAGTAPLANAPVVFTVQSDGGKLALAGTGSPTLSDTLTLQTDATGTTQAYYQQPATAGVASTIQAAAGGAQVILTTTSIASPPNPDTDNNGLPDSWEQQYFGHVGISTGSDNDNDGFTNLQEYQNGTNPVVPDFSPADSDSDGLPDAWERRYFGTLDYGPNDQFNDMKLTLLQYFQQHLVPRMVRPTIANGLRAWYNASSGFFFDGSSGKVNVWTDSSGNGLHLAQSTAIAQPRFVSGESGLFFMLLSGSQRMTAASADVMGGATDLTVFALLRPDASQTSDASILTLGSGASDGFRLQQNGGNTNQYALTWPRASDQSMQGASVAVAGVADQSQLLTLTKDVTTQTSYLNSEMQTTSTVPADLNVIPASVAIGGLTGGGFSGRIYEILIYNRALSASEREAVEFALLGKYRIGDTDANRLPDAWEMRHFDHIGIDPNADPDGDGLNNRDELRYGADPNNPDTDGDGMPDGWEVKYGYDPLARESDSVLNSDEDGDGLTLLQEAKAGTDPRNPDTDGDGLSDGVEVAAGLNPLSNDAYADSDGDGISNADEIANGTSPSDYYNGQQPVATSLLPPDGALLDGNHIAVRMTNAAGEPLVNAPVTFTARTADHGFSPTLDSKWTNARKSIQVRTDEAGIAYAYVVRTDELLSPLQ